MRLTAIGATIVALSLATAAYAQPAPPTDPVRLQLARDLIEASGGQKAAEARLTAIYSQLGKMFEGTLPAASIAIMDSMYQNVRNETVKALPELIDSSAEVYARNLTEAELRSYVTWLRSDAGQSIQAKMPAISQQAMEASAPMFRRMLPSIMQKAFDRTCAEKGCTPEQKQQITETINKIAKAS